MNTAEQPDLWETLSMGKGGLSPRVKQLAMRVAATGAVVSLGLMLRAGRQQKSLVLILLFTVWVLSPYVASVGAIALSETWPVMPRKAICITTVVFTVISVALYALFALGYTRAKAGFVFLAVPLASWMALSIVAGATMILYRRVSRHDTHS